MRRKVAIALDSNQGLKNRGVLGLEADSSVGSDAGSGFGGGWLAFMFSHPGDGGAGDDENSVYLSSWGACSK